MRVEYEVKFLSVSFADYHILPIRSSAILLTTVLLMPGSAWCQGIRLEHSILDGSGQFTTNGAYANLSASGQGGAVGVTRGGTFQNQAGFIGRILFQPALDTDGDGLANEIDPDNDNDMLNDGVEVSGVAFAPVTPTDVNRSDSDADGASDRAESLAGTDPLDPESSFRITQINDNGQTVLLSWVARNGKTYRIFKRDDALANSATLLATTNAVGGLAPWFSVSSRFSDTSATSAGTRFYQIEVLP